MKTLYFAQKAFIVHDGALLAVRKSADDPFNPGLWEVPGGRMEFGEAIDDHIEREVREEVGLTIAPGPPFHIWQWQLSRKTEEGLIEMQVVAVARFCRPTSFAVNTSGRQEDDYLGEVDWIPLNDIDESRFIDNMRPVLKAFRERVGEWSQRSG